MRVGAPLLGLLCAAAAAAGAWTLLGSPAEVDLALAVAFEEDRAPGSGPAPEAVIPNDMGPRRGDPSASRPGLAAASPRPATRAPEPPPGPAPRLATEGGWMGSLRAFAAVVAPDPAETLRRVEAALADATDPVARQNCTFHVALALPEGVATPWLRRRAEGAPAPDDREDALVALAFGGDAEARGALEALARLPSAAAVHRLLDTVDDHEALGRSGGPAAAAVLRSYRALEALDGAPYFKRTALRVRMAPWRAAPALGDADRRALLEAWLARWPGHPGSDDVAYRLARLESRAGRHVEAARWYSRATVLPDQDAGEGPWFALVATCELLLTPDDLRALSREEGPRTPNQDLLEYVHSRRVAARDGVGAALVAVEAAAASRPDGLLARAWRARTAESAPPGLDRGVDPLPADDPLRRSSPPPPEPDESCEPCWDVEIDWEALARASRLSPPRESTYLSESAVAQQLRAWETLAELERRAARASGSARADLLYKQAALLVRSDRVYFPAYAGSSFAGALSGHRLPDADRAAVAAGREAFLAESVDRRRAIDLFARVEREGRAYPGCDAAVFSRGMSWIRLASDVLYTSAEGAAGHPARRGRCLAEGVLALERCAALFPESPLSDDAARAAAFWRRTQPVLLGR